MTERHPRHRTQGASASGHGQLGLISAVGSLAVYMGLGWLIGEWVGLWVGAGLVFLLHGRAILWTPEWPTSPRDSSA